MRSPLYALAAGSRRQHTQAPNYLAITIARAPAQHRTRTHNYSCIASCTTTHTKPVRRDPAGGPAHAGRTGRTIVSVVLIDVETQLV